MHSQRSVQLTVFRAISWELRPRTGALSMMLSTPGFYCVVAEHAGRIVGGDCLDERSLITGVGPITIDRGTQTSALAAGSCGGNDRANEQRASGIRLVQA